MESEPTYAQVVKEEVEVDHSHSSNYSFSSSIDSSSKGPLEQSNPIPSKQPSHDKEVLEGMDSNLPFNITKPLHSIEKLVSPKIDITHSLASVKKVIQDEADKVQEKISPPEKQKSDAPLSNLNQSISTFTQEMTQAMTPAVEDLKQTATQVAQSVLGTLAASHKQGTEKQAHAMVNDLELAADAGTAAVRTKLDLINARSTQEELSGSSDTQAGSQMESDDTTKDTHDLSLLHPIDYLVHTASAIKDHFVEESERNKELATLYGDPMDVVPVVSDSMTTTKGEQEERLINYLQSNYREE